MRTPYSPARPRLCPVIQLTSLPLDRMSSPSDMVFSRGIVICNFRSGRACPMTTTGPLPAIRISCDDERLALLDRMGAMDCEQSTRYHYPTSDAVIDPCRGVLFIAVDPDPEPEDWAAVCGLIRAVGFTDGRLPHPRDPGEPDQDPLSGVFTWRLEYVDPCIWCDGRGTSGGCPLCQRTG